MKDSPTRLATAAATQSPFLWHKTPEPGNRNEPKKAFFRHCSYDEPVLFRLRSHVFGLYPSCPPFFWDRAIKPKSICLPPTYALSPFFTGFVFWAPLSQDISAALVKYPFLFGAQRYKSRYESSFPICCCPNSICLPLRLLPVLAGSPPALYVLSLTVCCKNVHPDKKRPRLRSVDCAHRLVLIQ